MERAIEDFFSEKKRTPGKIVSLTLKGKKETAETFGVADRTIKETDQKSLLEWIKNLKGKKVCEISDFVLNW